MAQDYQPQDINFDRPCVEWILEHYRTLSSGFWPGVRPSSGYTELPSKSRRGIHRAPFENPVLVAAEVMLRVKKCGLDGYLVEEKYIDLKSEEDIANERGLDAEDISRRINKVLWYCASGRLPRWVDTKRRKGQTYEGWKGHSFKAKVRKIPTRT